MRDAVRAAYRATGGLATRLPVRVPLASAGRPALTAYPVVRVVLAVSDEPFRLDDAAKPGKPLAFTFRGVAYELPPLTAWPVTAMTAAVAGRVDDALAEMLGEEAAGRLTDDGLTVGHLLALFEQAAKNGGV